MTFNLMFTLFILLLPLFGKAIDYQESLILYGGTTIFLFLSLFYYPPIRHLTKKFYLIEASLIILSLLSTIFSKNIGYSYYGLFQFIYSLIILNLALLYLDSKKLSQYLIYLSLFYSLILLLNKIGFITLNPQPSLDNFILQIWGHSYLADLLIFPITTITYLLLTQKLTKTTKYFYYLSLAMFLVTSFFTNSRSLVIALSFASFFLFFSKLSQKIRYIFLTFLILVSVIFCIQIFSQNKNIKSINGSRLEYWQESIRAFIDSPVFGNGPYNFFYINKKYQSVPFTNTNYAHNSLLEYLSLNGLPFTLILFYTITTSLIFQYKKNRLFFIIGITSLVNSFLDPSWNSIGIFCLSFFYIFHQNPNYVISSPPKNKPVFNLIILILISLFFFSKTSSDYLFISNRLIPSLQADPYNLNPRFAVFPNYLSSSLHLFQNDIRLYKHAISKLTLPESEPYFYKLFLINPKENIREYQQLAKYYFESENYNKLDDLLLLIKKNIDIKKYTEEEYLSLAQIAYRYAIHNWQNKQYPASIEHLQLAIYFSNGWGIFHIELANAYWHNNQKDLATKQLLVECNKYSASIKHCQQYLDQHPQEFLSPGTPDFQTSVNSLP